MTQQGRDEGRRRGRGGRERAICMEKEARTSSRWREADKVVTTVSITHAY